MVAKVDALLRGVIDSRLEAAAAARNGSSSYGSDLLGRMLTAASEGWEEDTPEFNRASVLHNCKLFYLAGQDTVANATCFTMLMLALHPEWQERARKEVLEVIGEDESFNAGVLSRLKVLGMIFNETMRTFTPGPTITRLVDKDLHLKNLFIPKGMTVEFAVGVVHVDKEYWGEDAGKFNPERFANGVAAACSHSQAFNPFGLGPKLCIGNNFAILEAKIILARTLRRFELLPSPKYKHYPTFVITTRPKFGLPIILKAR